jgi:SHS2 domain-containing protein
MTTMTTVEMFDHTADVGLRITADALNDLFRAAAEAMFDYIVVNRNDVRDTDHDHLALAAESTDELLVSWLNELIYRSETTHRLYSRFDVHVAPDGLSLEAEIGGEPVDRDRHILDHEVKAVTHHGLSLVKAGVLWTAEVILDI